jgi:hypothetical protein
MAPAVLDSGSSVELSEAGVPVSPLSPPAGGIAVAGASGVLWPGGRKTFGGTPGLPLAGGVGGTEEPPGLGGMLGGLTEGGFSEPELPEVELTPPVDFFFFFGFDFRGAGEIGRG